MAAPLLATIIRQGVAERVFDVAYPDEASEIVIQMGQALSTAMVSLVQADECDADALGRIERILVAYNRSLERVLGAAEGSLRITDSDALKLWLPRTGSRRGKLDVPSRDSGERTEDLISHEKEECR